MSRQDQFNVLGNMDNITGYVESSSESLPSQPSARDMPAKPKPEWKQPRGRPDVWEEESAKARDQTLKLSINLQQKKEAWSRGEATTRQDYHLRTGVANQKATLKVLKELVDYYSDLMRHKETDYAKVFTRKTSLTKQSLIQRCQEYIDINDSARPIIKMVEDQTLDVNTLIQRAKGPSEQPAAQQVPGQEIPGLSGIDYKPQVTDEEVQDYQRRNNQELIQIQRQNLANQDQYLDQIEVIAKSIKYEGQNFGKEVNEQTKMLEKLSDQIDHTKMGLSKVDGRLGELISEMSFCKLWTAVVVEVILIIVVLGM